MNNDYLKSLFDIIMRSQLTISKYDRKEYIDEYEKIIDVLVAEFCEHKRNNSTIFFIGNGGSSAIASHMTADYMKNGGMKTYSLYNSAVITCLGNDYKYEDIFSRQLSFLIKEEDLLVTISSSGNSQNIIDAIEIAKEKKAAVITLSGFKPDNKSRQLGDVNLYVPCEAYGMVETIHNLVLQQIVDVIAERDD